MNIKNTVAQNPSHINIYISNRIVLKGLAGRRFQVRRLDQMKIVFEIVNTALVEQVPEIPTRVFQVVVLFALGYLVAGQIVNH